MASTIEWSVVRSCGYLPNVIVSSVLFQALRFSSKDQITGINDQRFTMLLCLLRKGLGNHN